MIRLPAFLIQTLNNISEAAAILDEQQYVLFSNGPFNSLFDFSGGRHHKRCPGLSGLNLKTSEGGRILSPQTAAIPGFGQKIDVFIYLLNKHKGGNCFLVISKNAEKKPDQAKAVNPYTDEEKIRTAQLSPEFERVDRGGCQVQTSACYCPEGGQIQRSGSDSGRKRDG